MKGVTIVVGMVLLLTFCAAAEEHAYFDRKFALLTGGHAFARAVDTKTTCSNLARGGHEVGLPWQSCRAIAVYSADMVSAEVATRYLLHRHRWHRLEALNSAAWTVPATEGTIYTLTHEQQRHPVLGPKLPIR